MRYVIYSGDVDKLDSEVHQTALHHYRDGECAALPQALTNVGHTSTWRPGPRVVDLSYLNPGTVIANFKFDKKGRPYYPNQHGYHAALFIEFGPRLMSTGMPTYIWVMDQWVGARVKRRHKLARTPDEMKRLGYMPSEDANQFYVVVVQ